MGHPLLLAASLLLAHWTADWTPLSRPWMLAAKKHGTPILPIAAHAAMHAVLMACVLIAFGVGALAIIIASLMQFLTHWFIDIGKGRLAAKLPVTADSTKTWYWMVMGLDQYLHQLVILLMVVICK